MVVEKGLVSKNTLKLLGDLIREQTPDSTTKFTPREMVYEIRNLLNNNNEIIKKLLARDITDIDLEKYGVSGLGDSALAGCKTIYSLKIPNKVRYMEENALKRSSIASITVDNIYDIPPGAPWGANMVKGDVVWLRGEKVPVTLTQSPHQTIIATVDGKEFNSSFEYYVDAEISFKVVADDGYAPGELSMAKANLDSPIEVTVTDAAEIQVSRRLEFGNPADMPEDGWFGGLVLDSGDKFYFKYKIEGGIIPDGSGMYIGNLTLNITYPYTGDRDLIHKLEDTFIGAHIKTNGGVFECNGSISRDYAYLTIRVSDALPGIIPLAYGGPGYIEFLPKE